MFNIKAITRITIFSEMNIAMNSSVGDITLLKHHELFKADMSSNNEK